MRSGFSTRARLSPASASTALSTEWPFDFRRKTASVMFAGLSSITRTVAILDGHCSPQRCSPRHRTPYFRDEIIGAKGCLAHDRGNVAVEPGAICRADFVSCHYEN